MTDIDFSKTPHPKVAIVDTNTPAALGLKVLLEEVMPIMEADIFCSFAELSANTPESYCHYFVSLNILLENRPYFTARCHRTIVLTTSVAAKAQVAGFNAIYVCVPERQLVRSLLSLVQRAHGHSLSPMSRDSSGACLSNREIEVMVLIVRGYINKEIADKLNIGLSTVITHRKNIMEKLGMRSVSALTIYAVMNGYVDIDSI